MERPVRYALIVEDDPLQQDFLAMLLEDEGFQVLRSDSAESAQMALQEVGATLSVMVADNRLAGEMPGIELAAFALQNYPNIKVIVVSGKGRPLLPLGARFLQKPWQPLEMLRAVHAEPPRHS